MATRCWRTARPSILQCAAFYPSWVGVEIPLQLPQRLHSNRPNVRRAQAAKGRFWFTMNLGRCRRHPIPDATAAPRFGSDFCAIPLVVATGALQPADLEMSAAPTLATVLRSPEARGSPGRCRQRPGERAGCSQSTGCRPDASSADWRGRPTLLGPHRSVDCC